MLTYLKLGFELINGWTFPPNYWWKDDLCTAGWSFSSVLLPPRLSRNCCCTAKVKTDTEKNIISILLTLRMTMQMSANLYFIISISSKCFFSVYSSASLCSFTLQAQIPIYTNSRFVEGRHLQTIGIHFFHLLWLGCSAGYRKKVPLDFK